MGNKEGTLRPLKPVPLSNIVGPGPKRRSQYAKEISFENFDDRDSRDDRLRFIGVRRACQSPVGGRRTLFEPNPTGRLRIRRGRSDPPRTRSYHPNPWRAHDSL